MQCSVYIIDHLTNNNIIINMFLQYISVSPLYGHTVTREMFDVSNRYILVTFIRAPSKLRSGKRKIMPIVYSESMSILVHCYATRSMLKSIDKHPCHPPHYSVYSHYILIMYPILSASGYTMYIDEIFANNVVCNR